VVQGIAVIDSGAVWFAESMQSKECIKNSKPKTFYVMLSSQNTCNSHDGNTSSSQDDIVISRAHSI
jgi:hypothetical protein